MKLRLPGQLSPHAHANVIVAEKEEMSRLIGKFFAWRQATLNIKESGIKPFQ
jgi:hypothetical protein